MAISICFPKVNLRLIGNVAHTKVYILTHVGTKACACAICFYYNNLVNLFDATVAQQQKATATYVFIIYTHMVLVTLDAGFLDISATLPHFHTCVRCCVLFVSVFVLFLFVLWNFLINVSEWNVTLHAKRQAPNAFEWCVMCVCMHCAGAFCCLFFFFLLFYIC